MYLGLRNLLERLLALVALVLLAPLFVILALLIKLDGGPILFKQDRLGKGARIFKVFKFRSMIVDADNFLDDRGMPTRDRITKVGHIIRKTSLDELPQLINIFIGDMTVIGPRPILPKFLPYMTDEEKRRFSILPGITGWAQVNGRNNLKWSDRFVMDVHYVDNFGALFDARIMLKTLLVTFSMKDVVIDRNPGKVNDITTRNRI